MSEVNDFNRATFELEVDPGAQPIVGLLRRPGRDEVPFSGWLGLASALERLLADTTDQPTQTRRNK